MQLRHILTLTKWFRSRGPTCVFLFFVFFLMTNSDNVRLLLFPHLVEINIILHLVWTVLLQMKEQSDECDCVVFTLDHSSLNEQEKLVQQLCGAPVFV